jgi:hypothetical protein
MICKIIIKNITFLIDHSEYNCYKYYVLDRSDCKRSLRIQTQHNQQPNTTRQ